jgi:hypothetical protein
MTLGDIIEDPDSADAATVESILSNFRVTRHGGAKAQGSILVIVNRRSIFSVPAGVTFRKGELGFRVPVTYVVKMNEENVQSPTDRVLTPYGQNLFAFTISVEAEQDGASYNLRKDTVLTTDADIPGFVTAYAASDFVGGVDPESNRELLRRLQEGLAARAVHNRPMMQSVLRDIYPQAVSSSIIGYGDAEMLRDKHSVFPIATGGKVDWYIRTALSPIVEDFALDAILVEKRPDGRGIWQLGIGRDVAPGFYDVYAIRPAGSPVGNYRGSFEIVDDVRFFDTEPIPEELIPEIQTTIEAAYTRYQTAVIRFVDHLTPVVDLPLYATKPYMVSLRYMPDLALLQRQFGSRNFRHVAGDILVRAPIPAFVSMAFTIQAPPFTELPSAQRIKETVAKEVNRMGFVGRLVGSEIADIVYDFLPSKASVDKMDLFMVIRAADGSLHRQRSGTSLVVPYLPEILVTPRTVVFFLDPDNVVVNLEVVIQ